MEAQVLAMASRGQRSDSLAMDAAADMEREDGYCLSCPVLCCIHGSIIYVALMRH